MFIIDYYPGTFFWRLFYLENKMKNGDEFAHSYIFISYSDIHQHVIMILFNMWSWIPEAFTYDVYVCIAYTCTRYGVQGAVHSTVLVYWNMQRMTRDEYPVITIVLARNHSKASLEKGGFRERKRAREGRRKKERERAYNARSFRCLSLLPAHEKNRDNWDIPTRMSLNSI